MANTVSNVVAGKPLSTGGVLVAPFGTAMPTAVATAPNASFKAIGYVGEDGVTEGGERTTEKIKAWGGDIVKVLQTDHSLTFAFTMIETLNADALKTVYGDANVATTPPTTTVGTLQAVTVTGEQLPHKAWIIEVKDGVARVRICVADGQITEVGEVTYSDGSVIGYPVTLEAFPNASGVKAMKYSDDGIDTTP